VVQTKLLYFRVLFLAAACPPEWDFGTRFRTPDGREWICLDRGGAIRCGYTPYWMEYDGLAWADLLTSSPGYGFGEVAEIEFLDKGEIGPEFTVHLC
jgi:hypothetical protein